MILHDSVSSSHLLDHVLLAMLYLSFTFDRCHSVLGKHLHVFLCNLLLYAFSLISCFDSYLSLGIQVVDNDALPVITDFDGKCWFILHCILLIEEGFETRLILVEESDSAVKMKVNVSSFLRGIISSFLPFTLSILHVTLMTFLVSVLYVVPNANVVPESTGCTEGLRRLVPHSDTRCGRSGYIGGCVYLPPGMSRWFVRAKLIHSKWSISLVG